MVTTRKAWTRTFAPLEQKLCPLGKLALVLMELKDPGRGRKRREHVVVHAPGRRLHGKKTQLPIGGPPYRTPKRPAERQPARSSRPFPLARDGTT